MSQLVVEYRKIGLLPTCIGNERIRVAGSRVSYARNTRECEPDERWSDEWRIIGELTADAAAALAAEIRDSGLLRSRPESIDDTAEGGKREEISLTIDDVTYEFVVQNTEHAEFRRAVRALYGAIEQARMIS